MRKTIYGMLVDDDGMNDNEKAMLYIKECAESVGIEVIEGKTAFSMQFMARVMCKLRGNDEMMWKDKSYEWYG